MRGVETFRSRRIPTRLSVTRAPVQNQNQNLGSLGSAQLRRRHHTDHGNGTALAIRHAATAGGSTAIFFSSTANEQFGYSVDGLGDFSDDGFDDIVIGTAPTGGTVRVIFGGGT